MVEGYESPAKDLERMNVFITGATRGIGRGLMRQFLLAGHNVYGMDNGPWGGATSETAQDWARSSGALTSFHFGDLGNRKHIEHAVGEAESIFRGRLDLLINNAFPTPHTWADAKTMEDPKANIEKEWNKKLAVGLTAPFILSRLFVPMLGGDKTISRKQGKPGCIINISSTRAHQSEDNHEAYSACKAGLIGLTQSMAVSLGHRHGIRVNAISPGWIHVDNENLEADRKKQRWEEGLTQSDHDWHPVGRVGKVEDIYKAVMYCVENEFVTGQEITVDGGVSKKMVYPE